MPCMDDSPFRKAGLAEYAQASVDLARGDAVAAVTASYRRHEQVVAQAISDSGEALACKAGCTWCCHYKVDVRADEALALAEFVRTRLDVPTRTRVIEAARRNAATIRTLTPLEHLHAAIACCFLVDNGCSVYPARPLACRNYHSTDVSACIDQFERRADVEVPVPTVPELDARGAGHREGRQSAVLHAGLDVRAYDLTTAFLEAIENASVPKRLRQKKRALIDAIVID